MYTLHWHLGQENLADYQSKHHTGAHHARVRPWYLHKPNSPRELPRALKPSALKGCVGTQDGGYLRKVPLPRIPLRQSTVLMSCASQDLTVRLHLSDHQDDTCYLQVPRIPTWRDLARSHLGALRRSILPIAPHLLMQSLTN
jgi:hypothetical protein